MVGANEHRKWRRLSTWTVGRSVSSGCIRMINQDVIDLYQRTPVGARVVVLSSR
jgi:lipoprotein-anchoring transpeptidase ErfK/SrfK